MPSSGVHLSVPYQEMPDFYRFQIREKRREEIIDHRKRNAKDLDTVKQMKKARRENRTEYVKDICPPSIQKDDVLFHRFSTCYHFLAGIGRVCVQNQHHDTQNRFFQSRPWWWLMGIQPLHTASTALWFSQHHQHIYVCFGEKKS